MTEILQVLIGQIYESALHPNLWPETLSQFCRDLHFKHCGIILWNTAEPSNTLTIFNQEFTENFQSQLQPSCKIIGNRQTRSSKDALQIDTYFQRLLSHLRTAENTDKFPITTIELIDNPPHKIKLILQENSTKPLSTELHNQQSTLILHLKRSLEIYLRFTTKKSIAEVLSLLSTKHLVNLIYLNQDGQVIFLSEKTKEAIQSIKTLWIDENNNLRAQNLQDDKKLRKALLALPLMNKKRSISYFSLAAHEGGPPIKLSLFHMHNYWQPILGDNEPCTVAIISNSLQPWILPVELLMYSHRLTTAEIEIAQMLINGDDAHHVSAKRKTSIETVKSQIKQILFKFNCSSQGELVGQLILLCSDLNQIREL